MLNDEAINKYAVEGKHSTSFDVILSHDELVPASTDAPALHRERGWFYFLYKVSVKKNRTK